jgi:hypothetical protein
MNCWIETSHPLVVRLYVTLRGIAALQCHCDLFCYGEIGVGEVVDDDGEVHVAECLCRL